jgi:hypothetical protein
MRAVMGLRHNCPFEGCAQSYYNFDYFKNHLARHAKVNKRPELIGIPPADAFEVMMRTQGYPQ